MVKASHVHWIQNVRSSPLTAYRTYCIIIWFFYPPVKRMHPIKNLHIYGGEEVLKCFRFMIFLFTVLSPHTHQAPTICFLWVTRRDWVFAEASVSILEYRLGSQWLWVSENHFFVSCASVVWRTGGKSECSDTLPSYINSTCSSVSTGSRKPDMISS